MKKTFSVLTLITTSLFLASCGGGSSGGNGGSSYVPPSTKEDPGSGSGNTSGGSTSDGNTSGGNASGGAASDGNTSGDKNTGDKNLGDKSGSNPIAYYNGKVIEYEAITEAPAKAANMAGFEHAFATEPYRQASHNDSIDPADYGNEANYNTLISNGDRSIVDYQVRTYKPTEAFFKNEMRPIDGSYHQNHRVETSLALDPSQAPALPLATNSQETAKTKALLAKELSPYANYLFEKRTLVPLEVAVEAIPNSKGNLTANRADALVNKVTNEAKILVVDQDLTTSGARTKKLVADKRLAVTYVHPKQTPDPNADPIERTSHAEEVVSMIAAGMQQNLHKDPHNQSIKDPADRFLQPLFSKKGKIKVITDYPKNTNLNFVDSLYNSEVFLKAVNDGYTIVNESFAAEFKNIAEIIFGEKSVSEEQKEYFKESIEGIAKTPDSLKWLFNNQIKNNNLDPGQAMYRYMPKIFAFGAPDYTELRTKAELIKHKDLLFIKSTGNNKADLSNTLAAPDTFSPLLPSLLDGYLAVTAYVDNEIPYTYNDPKYYDKKVFEKNGERKLYANPCSYLKNYCLAAYDVSYLKDNKEDIYSYVGTSFSAPYVASVAGLVKSAFPFMHNSELQQTILTTAKDIGEKGIDDIYGWGLVQPQVAINGPKAIFRNFVVDFDYRRQSDSPEYTFANSIQAYHFKDPEKNAIKLSAEEEAKLKELQLIIKHPGVLVLSNHNPFNGKTIVTQGATLDLTGSIQGEIFIDKDSNLYSQGLAHTVNNKGHLYNYERQRASQHANTYNEISAIIDKCSSDRGIPGCKDYNYQGVELFTYTSFANPATNNFKVANFNQDQDGTLHLYLGDPLLVTNSATLNGTLAVEGLRELYRFNNDPQSFYGLALLSSKAIKGNFNKIDSKALPFTNISTDLEHNLYSKVRVKGKDLYYYLLNLHTIALNQGFMSLNLNKEEQAYSEDGLANLSSLEKTIAKEPLTKDADTVNKKGALEAAIAATQSLQPQNVAASLQSFAYDKGFIKAGQNSALATFLTGLKLSNQQVAKESLLAFSGSEYSRTFRNNQALSAFNSSELWIDHGQEQGFTSSFNLQQALANNNYNQTRNRLALAYGEENYHLLTALNYGSSAWDNPLSLGRSASKVLGLNLVGSYNYQGYNLALGLDYSHHNNKVRRELNILGKAHNFTQELTNDALDLSLLLAKNFNLEFLTFSPYLSLSYQSNRVGAFSEQLSSGTQSFTLGSDAQSYNFISPLLGFKLSKEINHNLSFLANVSYKYLPAGKLQARLKDKSHNIEQSFSFAKDHLFTVKSGLKYNFNDRVSLDVKGGLRKLSSYNGWTKELSVKVNYLFKK